MAARNKQSTPPALPEKILLWMEGRESSPVPGIVRGLGLAEALARRKIPSIRLVCSDCLYAGQECAGRGIEWRNLRAENGKQSLAETLREYRPDTVVLDTARPLEILPAVQESGAAAVLLADRFQEPLLAADTVLLPGFQDPPDFESLRVPPSHVLRCIQGPQYVPLPSLYAEPVSSEASHVLLAVDGSLPREECGRLLDALLGWDLRSTALLADVPPETEDALSAAYPELPKTGPRSPLPHRVDLLNHARVVVSAPTWSVYEYLARGKAVILLHGTEEEKQAARPFTDAETAVSLDAGAPGFLEELKKKITEMLFNHEQRKQLEQKAVERVSRKGAGQWVQEWIRRGLS